MSRSIDQRMLAAKNRMIEWKRVPRVFFLCADDYAVFERTNPPTMSAKFCQKGLPTILTCLAWNGLPVRKSQSKITHTGSKLYCCCGTSLAVPMR